MKTFDIILSAVFIITCNACWVAFAIQTGVSMG